MEVRIVFPDYQGKEALGRLESQFGKGVIAISQEINKKKGNNCVIIPLVNGDVESFSLTSIGLMPDSVSPFICRSKGLAPVTFEGYEHVLKEWSKDTVVVKLDSQEHDTRRMLDLIRAAENGMAIGDLEFSSTTLHIDTADELIHNYIFPYMYKEFSRSEIALSCAHGYQVFGSGMCDPILQGAKKIFDAVEKRDGVRPQWGLDGAMALSAVYQRIPVKVLKVPAIEVRNRPSLKIASQFQMHLKLCRAAEKVFS